MNEPIDLSKVRDRKVEAQIAASEKRATDLANIHGPCLEGMENLMTKLKASHAVNVHLRANVEALSTALAVVMMRSHVAAEADGKVGPLTNWPLRITDGEVKHLAEMGLGLHASRDEAADELVFTLRAKEASGAAE